MDIPYRKGSGSDIAAAPEVPDAFEDLSAHTNNEEQPESPALRRWAQRRCYGFTIGNSRLMVEQGEYCELLAGYRIAPLPNGPSYLVGLTNLRGNLVPVYSLHTLLGERNRATPYALLIGNPLKSAALTVTRKPVQFDMADWREAPASTDVPEWLAEVVTHAFQAEGNLWSVIDHEKLFRLLATGQIGVSR
jgi:chemotaxis signal transduction protein